MKVGDIIREKEYPTDACGVIVEIGDLRRKNPYKVFCFAHGTAIAFAKQYIQQECEVISEAG